MLKWADGGFRPGYQVQLAVAGRWQGGPRAIVAVRVSPAGDDRGCLEPLLTQAAQRTGTRVRAVLADGGCVGLAEVRALDAAGVHLFSPVPARERGARAASDAPVAAWHARMASEEGRARYRGRKALSEWANAQLKGPLRRERVLVRGLRRVEALFLLAAVALNLQQFGARLLRALGEPWPAPN